MTEFGRLALHTWTLDTTPLPEAIAAAKAGGFDAMELRHLDFKRRREQGIDDSATLDLIRAGGLPVCTLGCEYGWIFGEGEENERLFQSLDVTCRHAVALDCTQIMCAPFQNIGPMDRAIESLKRGADIVGAHGLTLVIEFNSQHAILNRASALRTLIEGAGRSNVGMLLDAYHLERSGFGGRGFEDVAPEEIAAFQFSDAPPAPVEQGVARPMDRLVPGQGIVRWHEVLKLLREKGYTGHLSCEAPNPLTWARPPADVAAEVVMAMRRLIALSA